MALVTRHRRDARRVVVVDGCRTPFCRSGTVFTDLSAYDLGRMAVAGLLHRTRLDPALVDLLVMGSVIADPATSNLGREVVLATQLPPTCPAHTVTMACVSSLQAVLDAARAIEAGAAEVAIAAGADTTSDVPIRFRRPLRKRLVAAQKVRGLSGWLGLLRGLKPADFLPEAMAIAEFSTGESMGASCERLAKRLGLGRREQDEYAASSHQRAAAATAAGHLAAQIVPALVAPTFAPVEADNGIRGDTTADKLARLQPAFDRRFGTVTAGNASFLTDGAAAVLLMSEAAATRLGVTPRATLVASAVAALDPREELLVGPAVTIAPALAAAKVELDEVAVVELHEAFAAQVLAVLRLLADDDFCRQRLGLERAVGTLDRARLNAWGGSLAIGHPFGATGARLVDTCVRRLTVAGGQHGLVAACAAGGLGIALVLERIGGG